MNAPAIYLVRFWLKPGSEKKVFDWLDSRHLKDVVDQPGFLWARRYRLTQPNAEGWPAYAMVYGVESLAALERYFASPATQRFAQERASLGLEGLFKLDRNWGALDAGVDA